MAHFLDNPRGLAFQVIDCRFAYEFKGGHIKGAININNPMELFSFFYGDRKRMTEFVKSNTIFIFHCEFS